MVYYKPSTEQSTAARAVEPELTEVQMDSTVVNAQPAQGASMTTEPQEAKRIRGGCGVSRIRRVTSIWPV